MTEPNRIIVVKFGREYLRSMVCSVIAAPIFTSLMISCICNLDLTINAILMQSIIYIIPSTASLFLFGLLSVRLNLTEVNMFTIATIFFAIAFATAMISRGDVIAEPFSLLISASMALLIFTSTLWILILIVERGGI